MTWCLWLVLALCVLLALVPDLFTVTQAQVGRTATSRLVASSCAGRRWTTPRPTPRWWTGR